MSKKALGKGLGALISEEPTLLESGIREIELTKIVPNPEQPRKDFDIEGLQELASSLKTHGLLQPILVRPVEDQFVIIAGERRFRAAQFAGMSQIPCLVQDCSDQEMAERALVENIQRSDLSPVEEGYAYARLMNEYGLTQEQIAARVGKGRPTIANLLRIIQLPERVLQLLNQEKLSLGHAKVLLGVKDRSLQVLIAEKSARENLSVRELELLIAKMANVPKDSQVKIQLENPFGNIEDRLRTSFQTKVRLKGDSNRGKIEIEFFSEDELNRLLEMWNVQIE